MQPEQAIFLGKLSGKVPNRSWYLLDSCLIQLRPADFLGHQPHTTVMLATDVLATAASFSTTARSGLVPEQFISSWKLSALVKLSMLSWQLRAKKTAAFFARAGCFNKRSWRETSCLTIRGRVRSYRQLFSFCARKLEQRRRLKTTTFTPTSWRARPRHSLVAISFDYHIYVLRLYFILWVYNSFK
jgi:hypothetical protein